MREPQVDRFCRCIKKVKKTIRIRPGSTKEQGAIAVCTKSILQRRGRTLRKVQCRKHMLQTQPMKGGELIAGGADTLVFYDRSKFDYPLDTSWFDDPYDIDEMMSEYPAPYEDKRKTVEDLIKKYRAAVRMISVNGSEMRVHRVIKAWFGAKQLDPFVQMHTNVWASNGVYKIDKDRTKVSGRIDKWKDAMEGRYGRYDWYGLITRYQNPDIFRLSGQERMIRLGELLRTILHIDGQFVHFDLHMGNAATMRDGTTVIHDFGRAKIRDYLQPFTDYSLSYPHADNRRVFRNALIDLFSEVKNDPDEILSFDQHFFIATLFDSIKDKTDIADWLNVSSYVPGNEESNKKNLIGNRIAVSMMPKFGIIDVYPYKQEINYDEATKSEVSMKTDGSSLPCFMNPMYETRYHHITRIFDLLSVLRAFESGFGKTSAYKTAAMLLYMIGIDIPCANRVDVERVINECLVGAYKEAGLEYKVITKEEEIQEAEHYWAEKKRRNDDPRMYPVKPAPAPSAAPAAPTAGGGDKQYEFDDKTKKLLETSHSKEPKAFTKLDLTPDEVMAEEKREPLEIPNDAPAEVKAVMEGIKKATVKTKDMTDDGLGEWTVVDKSGKHKGGTFRRKRLPRLV